MSKSSLLETQLLRWNDAIRLHSGEAKAYIQRGMVRFKLGQIAESIEDFNQAEQLDPRVTPYLWQRGLSYYYLDRFEEGAKQFEIDLRVNSQDVEETVWRYLCLAQLQNPEVARSDWRVVRNDPRPIMTHIYQLFAGSCTDDQVLRLGQQGSTSSRFYSLLYVGLYWEAHQNQAKAKEYIVQAVHTYPGEDYMWYLACVHQKVRGWGEN